MWSAPEIWATVIGASGLVWAVASSFIAKSAQKKANAAGAEAKSASLRAAEALEQANELTKRLLAPPAPPWTLTFDRVNMWSLQNHTGHVIDGVRIQSPGGEFPEQASTWDRIQPKSQIQLQAVAPFIDATIKVIWEKPEGDGYEIFPITVHSPNT